MNTSVVGRACTLYRRAWNGLRWMLTRTIFTLSPRLAAAAASGASCARQGRHQGAQKSTRTGTFDAITRLWNERSEALTTLAACAAEETASACARKARTRAKAGRRAADCSLIGSLRF